MKTFYCILLFSAFGMKFGNPFRIYECKDLEKISKYTSNVGAGLEKVKDGKINFNFTLYTVAIYHRKTPGILIPVLIGILISVYPPTGRNIFTFT